MVNASCDLCQFRSSGLGQAIRITHTSLLLALGLPLNLLALWVFCRLPRWTPTHVYMMNLATADLCLICTLPALLPVPAATPSLLCPIAQGCYLANRYMSISLVMALALDRYVAVRHPLRALGLRSPRRALLLCAALWVLVGGSLVLRGLLGAPKDSCFFGTTEQDPHTVTFSLLGFYLPLAVLAFCSLQVGLALTQRPATDSGQAETTRRAARMVWANLAVFLVCFLPLHLVLSVRLALGPGQHPCAFRCALFITSKLSDANGCLDAICYYYSAKEFQEASGRAIALSTKDHSARTQSA